MWHYSNAYPLYSTVTHRLNLLSSLEDQTQINHNWSPSCKATFNYMGTVARVQHIVMAMCIQIWVKFIEHKPTHKASISPKRCLTGRRTDHERSPMNSCVEDCGLHNSSFAEPFSSVTFDFSLLPSLPTLSDLGISCFYVYATGKSINAAWYQPNVLRSEIDDLKGDVEFAALVVPEPVQCLMNFAFCSSFVREPSDLLFLATFGETVLR